MNLSVAANWRMQFANYKTCGFSDIVAVWYFLRAESLFSKVGSSNTFFISTYISLVVLTSRMLSSKSSNKVRPMMAWTFLSFFFHIEFSSGRASFYRGGLLPESFPSLSEWEHVEHEFSKRGSWNVSIFDFGRRVFRIHNEFGEKQEGSLNLMTRFFLQYVFALVSSEVVLWREEMVALSAMRAHRVPIACFKCFFDCKRIPSRLMQSKKRLQVWQCSLGLLSVVFVLATVTCTERFVGVWTGEEGLELAGVVALDTTGCPEKKTI